MGVSPQSVLQVYLSKTDTGQAKVVVMEKANFVIVPAGPASCDRPKPDASEICDRLLLLQPGGFPRKKRPT